MDNCGDLCKWVEVMVMEIKAAVQKKLEKYKGIRIR